MPTTTRTCEKAQRTRWWDDWAGLMGFGAGQGHLSLDEVTSSCCRLPNYLPNQQVSEWKRTRKKIPQKQAETMSPPKKYNFVCKKKQKLWQQNTFDLRFLWTPLSVLELHIFWMPLEAAVLSETRSNVAVKLLSTSACVLKVFWGTTKTKLRIYVNKFMEGLGDLGRGAGALTQYSG